MKAALLAAVLLVAALPVHAEKPHAEKTKPDSVKTEIDKANAQFVAAFNAGDAAALAQLYTEKAVALPPGTDLVQGRSAIQAFWSGVMKGGLKNITLTAVTVERHGHAAREIGTFSFDAPGAPGTPMNHVVGKYVVLWKRIGNVWLLDTDIWNTNK